MKVIAQFRQLCLWVTLTMVGVVFVCLLLGCTAEEEPTTQTETNASSSYNNTIKQGQEAPQWSLLDITGQPFDSTKLQGKPTVINFWATWCPPCLAELPELEELYDAYRGRGLEVVGICMDPISPERLSDFVEERNLNFTFLMGDDEIAAKFGNFPAIPTTFLIDREGYIANKYMGRVPKQTLENGILSILNMP